MTGSNWASLARHYANADSTILPDATLLFIANPVKNDIVRDIVKLVDERYFEVPATTDLVADQREYVLPMDMLTKIKRVEAKLDGTNWVPLEELTVDKLEDYALTETNITTYFDNGLGQAKFQMSRSSLYLLTGTIIDVTGGLKLWYTAYPPDIDATDLANTTDDLAEPPSTTTHGIPIAVQEIWARETALRWKSNRDEKYVMTAKEQMLHSPSATAPEGEWKQAIESLADANEDRDIIAPYPDCDDTEDWGWNL